MNALVGGHVDALASGPSAVIGQIKGGKLRPLATWGDKRLAALPGTRLLALNNPGTIPDTGAYDVYLADGKTRVGTLDEEFIFETRVGDVFLLGSSTWRVQEITNDRVVVGEAAGSKLEKARQLGVAILDETALLTLISKVG